MRGRDVQTFLTHEAPVVHSVRANSPDVNAADSVRGTANAVNDGYTLATESSQRLDTAHVDINAKGRHEDQRPQERQRETILEAFSVVIRHSCASSGRSGDVRGTMKHKSEC